MSDNTTFFHLPEDPTYEPLRGAVSEGGSITRDGWLPLRPGDQVTIHGRGAYLVERVAFHVGHLDEQAGLHIFLGEVSS